MPNNSGPSTPYEVRRYQVRGEYDQTVQAFLYQDCALTPDAIGSGELQKRLSPRVYPNPGLIIAWQGDPDVPVPAAPPLIRYVDVFDRPDGAIGGAYVQFAGLPLPPISGGKLVSPGQSDFIAELVDNVDLGVISATFEHNSSQWHGVFGKLATRGVHSGYLAMRLENGSIRVTHTDPSGNYSTLYNFGETVSQLIAASGNVHTFELDFTEQGQVAGRVRTPDGAVVLDSGRIDMPGDAVGRGAGIYLAYGAACTMFTITPYSQYEMPIPEKQAGTYLLDTNWADYTVGKLDGQHGWVDAANNGAQAGGNQVESDVFGNYVHAHTNNAETNVYVPVAKLPSRVEIGWVGDGSNYYDGDVLIRYVDDQNMLAFSHVLTSNPQYQGTYLSMRAGGTLYTNAHHQWSPDPARFYGYVVDINDATSTITITITDLDANTVVQTFTDTVDAAALASLSTARKVGIGNWIGVGAKIPYLRVK